MSIRGPQALASLEDAMRDIRREEDEVSKRVARASERLSKTREHEAELFRQLARLRLDPAVQAELDERISGAEAKARDMLKAHAKDVSKAEKTIAGLDATRAELTDRRAKALAQLEAQQAQLNELTRAQAARLAADPDFVAQRTETEELDRIAATERNTQTDHRSEPGPIERSSKRAHAGEHEQHTIAGRRNERRRVEVAHAREGSGEVTGVKRRCDR